MTPSRRFVACFATLSLAAGWVVRGPATRSTALHAKTAVKKKKKAVGGGFGAAPKKKKAVDPAVKLFKQALSASKDLVRDAPTDAQAWLRLGAVLNKYGEYAEAERVFAAGVARCPDRDTEGPGLDAALLTLRGHSHAYHYGPCAERSRDVGFEAVRVGGADADLLEGHRTVEWRDGEATAYYSTAPFIPRDECAAAIEICERRAAELGGWLTARHAEAATTDMNVKDVPELLAWFNERLRDTLFPMLADRFPEKIPSADAIRVHDAFVVKYDENAQRSLPTHVDESAFSFTIALNDRSDYEGGGTRFEQALAEDGTWAPRVLNADAGGVVAFPGKVRHGGSAITAGTRYIIPLFCNIDENASKKPPGYVLADLLPGLPDVE